MSVKVLIHPGHLELQWVESRQLDLLSSEVTLRQFWGRLFVACPYGGGNFAECNFKTGKSQFKVEKDGV